MRTAVVTTGVLLLALALGIPAGAAPPATSSPSSEGKAAVVVLNGKINEFSRAGFESRMKAAQAQGAQTIIIDIDTYGGLVTSALEISQYIKGLKVHTIAFVHPKAYSAGAMIAMACDDIVMSPNSSIGDCAPIAVDEEGRLHSIGDAERAKMESPILNDFDASVTHRYPKREPDVNAAKRAELRAMALAMVAHKLELYWVEQGGQRRIVDGEEYKALTAQGWTQVTDARRPIDSDSTLLTVDDKLAVQLGLASGSAASAEDLASQRNLQIVATFAPTWGDGVTEWLLDTFNSAWVRGALLTIFLMCLYTALHAPGHGMPEAGAVMSLAVLLGVPLLTGYAQWWEIIMIMIGLALVAIEIFVVPGHLLPGFLGVLLMLVGIIFTFAGSEPGSPGSPSYWPQLPGTWVNLRTGVLVVVVGMGCSLLLMAWLRRYLPKMPYFSRLILSSGGPVLATAMAGGGERPAVLWPPVGLLGKTVSELRPGGSAEFAADAAAREVRVIPVISDTGYIPRGATVIVEAITDNQVIVREHNAA